jgi:simple sugar transport system substrate-binding protein
MVIRRSWIVMVLWTVGLLSDGGAAPCPGAEAVARPLRFLFVAPCRDEAFFLPVKKGMHDAAKMLGVTCDFVGTEDVDIPAQAAMVRKGVEDGYDGIAVCIIDAVGFDEAIAAARRQGVPVVAFNTDDAGSPNQRLSAVAQDVYQAGRSVGAEAARHLPEGCQVLFTLHSAGVSALDDRLRGIQEMLKPKGITGPVVVTGTTAEASAEVIVKALKDQPQLKGVLCTGQADTEGAGLAVEKHFGGKGYYLAGFDLSPNTLRLLRAGVIQFTIDQQPYGQGFYPVVQLTLWCRYGLRPASMDAGATLIRPADVDRIEDLTRRGYR